jgi:hypothetical protein
VLFSRSTVRDSRVSEPLARAATSFIRRVRCGDMDSIAITWYSKWPMPASCCSWASIASGSQVTIATTASQVCCSSAASHRGSSTASTAPLLT